jgi:formylglycine-generating enzyme required for sulfatase activity
MVAALTAFGAPAVAAAAPKPAKLKQSLPKPAVLTFKTAVVGSPGNPSVGIIPFSDAAYSSCTSPEAEAAAAEEPKKPCQQVGSVKHRYGINELEVTVKQWVAFLNTVDPLGRNSNHLYSETESGGAWPRFGQIDFNAAAPAGRRYTLAAPDWADKPYAFANFLRSARFVNSLYNGKVISRRPSTSNGFKYITYRVRLSPITGKGMYDMGKRAPVRTHESGFVLPSQNEWIKAAYYDPATDSYWKYPTNAGVFGDNTATAPNQSTLDPATGDVTNAAEQPVATFHAEKTEAPNWCPSNQTAEACATVNPFGIPPKAYAKIYAGSVGTVGQAKTFSPWGTLDQGGNVVEWTDTITPPPFGVKGHRVWRRLHGGIANAPVYQLWLSAIGLNPQDNAAFTAAYPWLGLRIGVIGSLVGKGR